MAHEDFKYTTRKLIRNDDDQCGDFFMVNFKERYLESKGSPETRLENPPGNLALPGDLEENASHQKHIVVLLPGLRFVLRLQYLIMPVWYRF